MDRLRTPSFAMKASMSRRRALRLGAGAVVATALAACGDTGSPDRRATAGAEDPVDEFTIVAENMRWDVDRVVVPAGVEVTATIENRDRGVLHNLHIQSPEDSKTELEEGVVTQTLTFTIAEPGEYEYVCDAHLFMSGTIVAV
jgi:plastocyanin